MSKIWLRNETKNINTSSHMLLDSSLSIRFVAVAFRSEEEVSWRRGPPWPILAPPWIRPWADLAEKTTTLVRDHEYFIPTKFHQNPSSGSGEEVANVKSLRTDGRTDRQTDGRTDDGRCTMTIAHSSLRLRWAKKWSLCGALLRWHHNIMQVAKF